MDVKQRSHALAFACASMSVSLHAETLNMPAASGQSVTTTSITLPGRGMSMDEVESRFGAPKQKFNQVGDPPITRWLYEDFTVYFEYTYVINAVSHTAVAVPKIPEDAKTVSEPEISKDDMPATELPKESDVPESLQDERSIAPDTN